MQIRAVGRVIGQVVKDRESRVNRRDAVRTKIRYEGSIESIVKVPGVPAVAFGQILRRPVVRDVVVLQRQLIANDGCFEGIRIIERKRSEQGKGAGPRAERQEESQCQEISFEGFDHKMLSNVSERF